MKLIEFIRKRLNDILLEANQYSKLITISEQRISQIRKKHSQLNQLLSDSIFNDKNIYLKGGVARLATQLHFGLDGEQMIRDLDYCYIGTGWNRLKRSDYEVTIDFEGEKLEDYFSTRDISLNEVLLRPNELILTRRAFRDYQKKVINNVENYLDERGISRILLFAVRYNYSITSVVQKAIERHSGYSSFQFLVSLLKAYEVGVENSFFNICRKYGIHNKKSLSHWLVYLLLNVWGFSLYGREKIIIKDIQEDGEISKETLDILYKEYPEIKNEVDNFKIRDIDSYKHFFKKPNRTKWDNIT